MGENKFYDYRLSGMDFDGNVECHILQLKGVFSINITELFVSYLNYPNPFNFVTIIRFGIAESGFRSLKVLNMLGQDIITTVDVWKDV